MICFIVWGTLPKALLVNKFRNLNENGFAMDEEVVAQFCRHSYSWIGKGQFIMEQMEVSPIPPRKWGK